MPSNPNLWSLKLWTIVIQIAKENSKFIQEFLTQLEQKFTANDILLFLIYFLFYNAIIIVLFLWPIRS